MNPTLALSTWIWSAAAYHRNIPNPIFENPTDPTDVDFFNFYHLGRYVAIYLFAPILAAFCAGPLAGHHISLIKDKTGDPTQLERTALLEGHKNTN